MDCRKYVNSHSFACMFDDYSWKSFVYWTNFSYVKYQDLCETINPSKIEDLENQKQSLKYLCNINLILNELKITKNDIDDMSYDN